MNLVIYKFKRRLNEDEIKIIQSYDVYKELQLYMNSIQVDVVYPYLDKKGEEIYEEAVLDKIYPFMKDGKIRVVIKID